MKNVKEMTETLLDEKRKRYLFIGVSVLFFACLIGILVNFYGTIDEAAVQKKKTIIVNTSSYEKQFLDNEDVVEQSFIMNEDTISAIFLRFNMFDASQEGIINISLLKEQVLVEQWAKKLSELKRDVYTEFALSNIEKNAKDTIYTIRIQAENLESDQNVSYYRCAYDRIENSKYTSSYNGESSTQDLLFEVASDEEAYSFVKNVYIVCSVIVILLFIALFYFLFVKKIKTTTAAVGFVFALGILYTIVLPPLSAPDEPKHFAAAYHLSNVLMFDKQDMENGYVFMRKSDAEFPYELCPSISTYKSCYEGLFSTVEKGKALYTGGPVLQVKNSYMYLPSAIGITVGRVLNLSTILTVELGKIFNLLFFCAMLWLAMKITPFGKLVFAGISFFPMVLEQIGSYSYDVFVLGGYFAYIAFLLHLIYDENEIKKKEIAILSITTFLLAPCKAIYICVGGLIILIYKKVNKKKFAIIIGIFIVSALISEIWVNLQNIQNQMGIGQNVTIETDNSLTENSVEENTSEGVTTERYYSTQDFIQQPLKLVKIYIYTLKSNLLSYILTMGGYRLGWLEIPVSMSIIGLCYIGVLVFAFFSSKRQKYEIKLTHRLLYLAIFVFVGVLAMYTMLTGWTPVSKECIEGVQGRYFLPAAPLAFLAIQSNKRYLNEKVNNYILIFLGAINIVALIQVLETTLFR